MIRNRRLLLLLVAALALSGVSTAQDSYENAPVNFGDFKTQGSASFGYRFTDVQRL